MDEIPVTANSQDLFSRFYVISLCLCLSFFFFTFIYSNHMLMTPYLSPLYNQLLARMYKIALHGLVVIQQIHFGCLH